MKKVSTDFDMHPRLFYGEWKNNNFMPSEILGLRGNYISICSVFYMFRQEIWEYKKIKVFAKVCQASYW